jgi:isopenicillin N synthase-like dioxygenase
MSAFHLPVLDISNPDSAVAKRLVDAISTYGFVYIKNDGYNIPVDGLESMFSLVTMPDSLMSKADVSRGP